MTRPECVSRAAAGRHPIGVMAACARCGSVVAGTPIEEEDR
jgi:hypothetical protein